MRILTLSNSPLDERLGSGKSVIRFSDQLKRLGHSVLCVGPESFESFPSIRRGTKLRQAFGGARFVTGALKRFAPDIVELYGDEFWLALKWLRGYKTCPLLVAHTNGLELLDWERRKSYEPQCNIGLRGIINRNLHQRLSLYYFSSVDGLACLCEADRNYAVEHKFLSIDRTAVIRPGLDLPFLASTASPERENRIGFTGSWIARKGINVLIDVIGRVLREKGDYHFDIFGANKNCENIQGEFPTEIRSRIVVHGLLSDQELVSCLERCQIFLFPSEYEGFGMALTEAMACGCAVVTTPTGFGAEIVSGEDGFIFQYGDSTAAYETVMQLIESHDLRFKVADRGRMRVRQLNWEKSGEELAATYEGWLARHRQTRNL